MFPCCHSSPEAFHLSFVLKGGGWHGLIIRNSSPRWSCSSGPWYGRRWGNLFMNVELQVVKLKGILSSTSSSSYTSSRKGHIRITQVQFRSEHTSSFLSLC